MPVVSVAASTPVAEEAPTAVEIARALRAGDASARDVVEGQLARIAQLNPALNAVVTVDADGARRRAVEADRALAHGEVWGPLHGVPITIKDSFDTAGLRTVSGYPPFRDRIPETDAVAVARLRRAGAIILGKTNLPTLASGIQTDNPVFGRTNNPWDLRRTPGGSSGGAAAAVAARLSFLELGSDIGGSIRIPSHFCGVCGLKTTAGRVAGKGHVASARRLVLPEGFEPLLQLASFGPIARTVDDLELVLPVLSEAGPPSSDDAPARATDTLRIAWSEDFGGTPLDRASRRVMADLEAGLTGAGHRVERVDPNLDFDAAWHTAGVCLGAINTLFQPPIVRLGRHALSPLLRLAGPKHALFRGLFTGMGAARRRVREALARRLQIIDELDRFFEAWDVWMCPVFPTPAFTHRSARAPIEVDGAPMSQLEANLRHSLIFNLTGHPVVALPAGLSGEELPIGVQIVGKRWHDMALLGAAKSIVQTTGVSAPPPLVSPATRSADRDRR